jgi:NTE family protein
MVYPSKKEILKQHPLFESLSWWQFRSLADNARIIEVPKGEVILREGEHGDAFYIVISGRCEASTESEGQRRRLEQYHNGDSFGETSLLSEETNWATVRAINDTLLLKINKEHIDELTKNNANVSRLLSERIAKRVNQKEETYENASTSRIVSIGSGLEEIGKTLLGVNAATALKDETGESICLVDFTRHPNEDVNQIPSSTVKLSEWVDEVSRDHPSGITVIPATLPPDEEKNVIGHFFGSFMTEFDYVFSILPEGLSPVVMEAYAQSDEIFILTDLKEHTLYQTRLLINQLRSEFNLDNDKLKIILSRISPSKLHQPSGAEDKLNYPVSYKLPEISKTKMLSPLKDDSFVNQYPDHVYSVNVRRIARRIGGVAVGLALGAGAARGLSHIGVIRVLEEENIHVDYVAGTSIGALVAAGWASGADPDQMEEFAKDFEEMGGLWNISDLSFPPTRSILRIDRIKKFLDYMLGDTTFSDTQFPLKIVSANLDRLEETVLDEGLLADAVRESISIPMVFPPVVRDGEQLVDGGVLNPIPVNVLAQAGASRIIAVNPIPPLEVLRETQHGQGREATGGFWEWIKQQILPFGRGNILDTFMRSLQAMQARLAASSSTGADIVINPIVSTEEWFKFEEHESFIEQGEMTARQHLDDIRTLLKESTGKKLKDKDL